MRRRLTNAAIAAYLTVLTGGLAVHALDLPGKRTLPAYFVVWDMFCGWNGFEQRIQYVAVGESGATYDLGAATAGHRPYHAELTRRHYDYSGCFTGNVIRHKLATTEHEPIERIFVIEEAWSKQFNLSDDLYRKAFGREKSPRVHRYVRAVFDGDANVVESRPLWLLAERHRAMLANPRLANESVKGRLIYAVSQNEP